MGARRMSQLLLPAPYGLGKGHHISLRSAHEDFDHEATARAIAHAGCPAFIVPKVIRCLHYSGRYDCLLQAEWFNMWRAELEEQLARAGVRLLMLHEHRPKRVVDLHNVRRSYFPNDELLDFTLERMRQEMEDHRRAALIYSLYSYTIPVSRSLFSVINPEPYS